MDPLTHGLLGGGVAALVCRDKKLLRPVAFTGMLAAWLPDLDILISSAEDPLLAIEYHRHFTHAWVFQPLNALLACGVFLLLARYLRTDVPVRFSQLYLPALAAALSHPFCDALTSYGTQVWWPFSDRRVAWDVISVIDPLFTIGLLVSAAGIFALRSRRLLYGGLLWCTFYLGLCVVQQQRALNAYKAEIAARGHIAERLTVKPSLGNIVLWRGIYEAEGSFYVDGIRAGSMSKVQIRKGADVPVQRVGEDFSQLPEDSTQRRDIERFAHFSANWIAWHPQHPDVLADIRYSILPESVEPLWGIRIDPTNPRHHVEWVTFRKADASLRKAFWQRLWGGYTCRQM